MKDDKLYHYTNSQAFLSIINNKSLWATNIHFLNDTSEFKHTLELTKDIIDIKTNSNNKKKVEFLLSGLEGIKNMSFYCISFSEEDDLLSQWRSYGQGNNGLSLGFSKKEIKTIGNSINAPLIKCIYKEQEQREKIEEIVNRFLDDDKEWETGNNVNKVYKRNHKFDEYIYSLAVSFKHYSFREEAEWRLVIPHDGNRVVKHRAGQSYIIPYVEFPLEDIPSALKQIIIGPTPNTAISKKALKHFFSTKKIAAFYEPYDPSIAFSVFDGEIELIVSKIPYRNW
jgi:hypothetical protein|tara:strand:- start:101 stop:949 length:849 start_codon:yes stop_codon:yes gene_type:complete